MSNSFNDLGITPPILKALTEMGFEEPTEVQSKAIPHILNREDIIVKSKTGSGKTAVFGVTMLQLIEPESTGPQGLILTPTRELAVQVDNDIRKMAAHLKHRTAVVYGQHSMSMEIKSLEKGVSIVTGTPGRIYDHISHGNLVTKNIRYLVLDEADRMLDMGFIDQVVRIVKTLPKDRVTLLFSATIPDKINHICREYMKNPTTIEIESQTKTVDTIEQVYYRIESNEKRLWLNRLLLVERPESCMIFCNTRIAVDQVQSFLTKKGYYSQELHGDIPQGKRSKTIQQFKQGEFYILVATDVAARGIHIDSLSLVINYDVPNEKDSYVHRIGRTGRAGKVGRAITLVTGDDIISLYEIEEHIGAMIEEAQLPTEADYNEHEAEIDNWIKMNSLKSKPSWSPSDTRQKPNAVKKKPLSSKPSYPRQAQHNEKRDNQTIKGNTNNTNNRRNYNDKPSGYARPTHGGSNTVQPRTTGNIQSNRTIKETLPVQNQSTAPKKSFLKRLLERILGK
jgi:Superfamily II DNA and RNA helicases